MGAEPRGSGKLSGTVGDVAGLGGHSAWGLTRPAEARGGLGRARWPSARAVERLRWPTARGVERPRSERTALRGFSLIELMIVIALMALLSGILVGGSGVFGGSRLRASSAMVMGAVRLALTQANAGGEPMRLVFDFEQGRVALEQGRGKMLRSSPHEGAGPGAGAAEPSIEKQASEYASDLLSGPKAPRASFSPAKGLADEDGKPGRALGQGVRLVQVQTEHDLEPVTEGQAYLYFWPGGTTEQAAIQLTRSGDEEGVTIVVSSLTGRARLIRGRVELEQGRTDAEVGEREAE